MNSSELLAVAPIWYVVFLFSIVCHEAAHALVAQWGGDDTAYHGGQVTIDPLPHIRREPFGLVIVPLLTIVTPPHFPLGWGSAPFDPHWQVRYPRRAALMALAGPVANFSLAILAALSLHFLDYMDVCHLSVTQFGSLANCGGNSMADGLQVFLSLLFSLNIILGVFNLLPLPPLDGYTVLGLVLPERTTLQLFEFSHTPGFAIFGLLIAWQVFPLIAMPTFRFALELFRLW